MLMELPYQIKRRAVINVDRSGYTDLHSNCVRNHTIRPRVHQPRLSDFFKPNAVLSIIGQALISPQWPCMLMDNNVKRLSRVHCPERLLNVKSRAWECSLGL
jgi:hypothetical protein